MFIKQLSVFLENRTGALLEVTKILKDASINIRALCLADTADFGVLRVIVDDPTTALRLLRENGITAKESRVLAVHADDKSGSFHGILEALNEREITVEYSYVYVAPEKGSTAILKCRNPEIAGEQLIKKGYKLLTDESAVK